MDVIEILSDDDDAPAPVRAEIDEEEDSQEVCFLSTTPAPRKASPELHVDGAAAAFAAPVTLSGGRPRRDDAEEDVVEVVNPDELSGKAKDALLKSLLAEKQALARKVDGLEQEKKHKEHEKKQSTRPVYWRRDGAGKRLVDDGSRGKTVVDLVEGSDEYASVARRVLSHGIADATIRAIRRVHNDDLWDPYCARRAKMAKDMGGGESMIFQHDVLPGVAPEGSASPYCGSENPCRERYLFHGAAPATIDKILDDGVDFRLSQITGAMGACAYFADQSSYSDQYCRMPDHSAEATAARGRGGPARPPDAAGGLKMLVCRVLLGHCGRGAHGLRRPPARADGDGLCDSVSNSPDDVVHYNSQGFMFGVFDNAQVYPEYVVEYTRAGHPGHARANLATANAMLAALAGGAPINGAVAAATAALQQYTAAKRKAPKPAAKKPAAKRRKSSKR